LRVVSAGLVGVDSFGIGPGIRIEGAGWIAAWSPQNQSAATSGKVVGLPDGGCRLHSRRSMFAVIVTSSACRQLRHVFVMGYGSLD
jgi:hypothetical protein